MNTPSVVPRVTESPAEQRDEGELATVVGTCGAALSIRNEFGHHPVQSEYASRGFADDRHAQRYSEQVQCTDAWRWVHQEERVHVHVVVDPGVGGVPGRSAGDR